MKPLPVLLGIGGIVGMAVLAKRAKAAQAASSASSSPTTFPGSPSSAPRSAALAADAESIRMTEIEVIPDPSTPATPRTPPEEGQPLAWKKQDHPLAERGLEDPDFPPNVRIIADVHAPPAAPRPPSSAAAAKPSSSKPKPSSKPSSAAAPPAAPTPPAAAVMVPKPGRSAEQAARELYNRATALLKAGKGAQLGTRNAPSAFVREAQQDMGGIAADGIYGGDTRTRGKALLGKSFPVRK